MEFSVQVWRNYYDQVKILGQHLKDSRPDWEGNPPRFKISLEEQHAMEKEVEELLKISSDYLDKCKIYPREPKWYYDRNNKTTWPSSEKFQYSHLMARKKYVTIRI